MGEVNIYLFYYSLQPKCFYNEITNYLNIG